MRKKISLSYLAVFLAISFCYGQVPSLNPVNGVVPAIVNSAGGTYDNALSYYRYEWSVGELVLVQAFAPADSAFLITQGVLQPCTDEIHNSPYTVLFENGDYKLFPNPTSGKFEVDFFVKTPGQMSLQLINSVGSLLEKRSYHYDGCCRIEMFDLSKYPNGVYFVVADLKPDVNRPGDNLEVIRHSGLKVIKMD
ncbi:MAG: hypothetical protein IPM85_08445 [Chitinophagaceae bacterium]|nr:hypothetical protein [Chitinophagaceae bacterium]